MSQTGTIVHRKANTFLPNEFVDKLLAANGSGWGAAVVMDGELQLNSADEGMTVEFLQETCKAFPDKDITFYMCSAESGLSINDISPYILVVKKEGEEEVPQIVGFVEGNYPSFVKDKSSHPPEYHMVSDYLIPKLESMYEMADGDLSKVTEQLKKPHFKKELLLTSVSRGTITLVCANGAILTFAQNDLSGEFGWGWTSNTHGYEGSAVKAAAVAETVKKKSMFPSRSTVREAAPSAKIAEAVKSDTTAAATIKNYTVKKWKPDAHWSRKDKKNAYQQKIGYAPPGWEQGIAIDVYVGPDNKVMTFAQVKELGLAAASLPKLNNPPRGKDTDNENIDSPKADVNDRMVATAILPLMGPKTREHIKDMLKTPKIQKILADNADIITDPKIVEGFETKFADFARQLGAKTMDEFAGWSYEMMLDLGKSNPDGLAVMCNTFRNSWLKLRQPLIKEELKEVKEEVKDPNRKIEKVSMFPKRATG